MRIWRKKCIPCTHTPCRGRCCGFRPGYTRSECIVGNLWSRMHSGHTSHPQNPPYTNTDLQTDLHDTNQQLRNTAFRDIQEETDAVMFHLCRRSRDHRLGRTRDSLNLSRHTDTRHTGYRRTETPETHTHTHVNRFSIYSHYFGADSSWRCLETLLEL